MTRILQFPAVLVGTVTVLLIVALSIVGLLLARRVLTPERLKPSETVGTQIFTLAGVLYAVLMAFVVVVVWEQFNEAQDRTESEANAISDLLHDSEGLPAAVRPAVQQSLLDYARDVADDEFVRMRRGEIIEQQSDNLTEVWQSFLDVEPRSEREIAYYNESISKLNDLGTARKERISASDFHIPGEMWVLLLGGGAVMLIFTYSFATPDLVLHSFFTGLCGALLAFVLYLIFAMEHPFVGTIAVTDSPYLDVLRAWAEIKGQ
jgi:hypothetical protein